ncbi:MAG: hypothetical protein JXR77_12810, partial [Lentisphaeria bacterium]|nr:hypothetical protein [Lentisphaeria bacterium]
MHLRAAAAILPVLVVLAGAGPLAPVPGNIQGKWRFATDPQEVGERQGWQRPEFDDSGWRELVVPGLWEPQGITEPRPGSAPIPKGRLPWTDYDGVAWYRLRVTVPAEWQGDALVLRLGCIDDHDRTFFNGTLVGETGPGLEIPSAQARRYVVRPDLVRYGGENCLAVAVRDLGGPGGWVGPLVALLPDREMAMEPLPAEDRPFEERLADPPGSTRILKIVHRWPDGEEAERELLAALRYQGFGGVVTNVAWG